MIGLRLTDGNSTIDLQAGDFAVMDYTPQAAARSTDLVGETIEVEILDPGYGQLQVRAIQQMITNARIRDETGYGRRVFLEFRTGIAGDGYWRSEIVDGRVELPEDQYHYDIISGYLAFTIYITRINFWEFATETVCLMQTSYPTGSGTAGSDITVYGHHRQADTHANLLRVLGSSISGDLPTPCRIQITNNYSSDGPGDIIVGHMLEDDTNTLEHIIEGETSATYFTASKPSLASTSGGQYYRISASGGTPAIVWSAPITQFMLQGMGGNEFNVMIRIPGAITGSDTIIRVSIATEDTLSGLIERWSGRETLVPGAGWLTLGRVQLPPRYLTDLNAPAPLRLRLHCFSLSGGSYALPVDYVMFMPTYGYRRYRRHSYGMNPSIVLHDKPYEGNTPLLYTDGWTEGKLDNYIAEGDPIKLVPNRDNLLCFAMTTMDTVARTMSVRVAYRPRRITI